LIVDSRYHAASLAAIFLALGLGIIIGSILVGEDFSRNVVVGQDELIRHLEEDYDKLKDETERNREEMAALQEALAYYQDFAEETLPGALAKAGITVCWPAENPHFLETIPGQLEVIKALSDLKPARVDDIVKGR